MRYARGPKVTFGIDADPNAGEVILELSGVGVVAIEDGKITVRITPVQSELVRDYLSDAEYIVETGVGSMNDPHDP